MLKYSVKDWKKLMPRTKFTAEDVIKYMQKTIFKDNYIAVKSNIVMRFENETRNSLVFRIHINDGFCLDIEEYDKSCYIFDARKDKTIKMSYRNAFILLQNLEERIKDIQFKDSWYAVMEIVKEYNEEKEDKLYCNKHAKALLSDGTVFYCPDCIKETNEEEDYTFQCKGCGEKILVKNISRLMGKYYCLNCLPEEFEEDLEE